MHIVSEDVLVHLALLQTMIGLVRSCSLTSIELAGPDAGGCRSDDLEALGDLSLALAILAVSTDIVAVSIRNLNVPSGSLVLRGAASYEELLDNDDDAPAAINQSLLVFDHPGLDLGTDLTRLLQELTHDNRRRFALPDAFFKGAARSFGGQAIHAPDVGDEIAKRLIPETGPRQDELRLALLNTTSYRAAMTGRSGEFKNELFKLIDGRKTGAIHTLRRMMLDAHVGLTEQHLEAVWQHASERGVELPDLPVQWLPPDR